MTNTSEVETKLVHTLQYIHCVFVVQTLKCTQCSRFAFSRSHATQTRSVSYCTCSMCSTGDSINSLPTHIQMQTLTRAHTGHGEVAVTVIGSCCQGQTHNSQLSVIIHHRSSCGLDACVCVCMCVIVGEIGKLLVIYFSLLRGERRNVEEGDRGEFEEARRRYAEWIEEKAKGRLMIIFDSC